MVKGAFKGAFKITKLLHQNRAPAFYYSVSHLVRELGWAECGTVLPNFQTHFVKIQSDQAELVSQNQSQPNP